MPYSKLFYHIIWSTKNREPNITAEIEEQLHTFIVKKAIGLGGIIHAINGTDDHIHLAVSIPASIPISRFIGQIKAVSSTKLNKSNPGEEKFFWQSEYSVFSFGEQNLQYVVRYIKNQKQHHFKGTEKINMEIQESKKPALAGAGNCPVIHDREIIERL
jgi:REP element-mobilizing transposase RayT